MTWSIAGVGALALVLVAACSGRVASSSDTAASSSGGRVSTSGGTSSAGAAAPTSDGGTTGQVIPITSEPTLATTCGNGQLEQNEQCDDGNKTRSDGCTGLCQLEPGFECPKLGQPCVALYPCGNGVVDGTNVCDDGNQMSGDGCDASCTTIEPGWQCRVPGRPCVPWCGDGIRTGSEECDEGPTNGTFLQGQTVACSMGCTLVALCQSEVGTVICPSVCGNGLLEINEQCDYGVKNDDAYYGECNTRCTLGPYCGDGVVNGPEACDAGLEPVDIYGKPGCTAACQRAHYCGDGFIDTVFEEFCDGGQACAPDCTPYLGP